ncbi:tyrosine-type recombinase/integrase [Paraglaciecola chathamensis]|jgi:integrase/recombinase XerD|uniref:Integrase n=1 Tax=Paraglaciecola chathamensis TaxID=368405 RepID=A0A8H9M6T9_9ALTE|nr:site-specific integrase [Paraglaciecola oceanifecundans]AEE25301.1 integrase family protein [Glaciecola sp. 4H-3-7+YE-5]GGZ84184.1 integrase [Paraglaciecola oceanifecundans]|tara:strand:+ start:1050 stop:1910 length:861 start_codon:yes stop_codon:yes gene_type:complete
MSYFTENTSPLRQRMIEDMTMRRLSPKTQIGYIRGVKKLAAYLKRSPEDATAEELRQFQLALAEQGASNITINATLSGLKFLFHKTLNLLDVMLKVSTVPVPRKLPTVLSKEEVKQLIDATHTIKYKAAFSVAYGAGLRIGEVVALKVTDIDSSRMLLRIEQGKGKKDRMAMLLTTLCQWYKHAKAHHLMLNGGWLFPGQNPLNPIGTRQLSRAWKSACIDAGLTKKVSMHTLRHSFAMHLLEDKVDIRVIQTLLGHSKLETTALYAQVASKLLQEVVSPLDTLAS